MLLLYYVIDVLFIIHIINYPYDLYKL